MKPIILAVLLALFTVIFWPKNLGKPFTLIKNTVPTAVPTPAFSLPQGWTLVSETPVLKYEKESKDAVKPGIALMVSSLPPGSVFNEYLDKMVRGARSGLSGLQISSDQSSPEGDNPARILEGTYYQGKTKVGFIQKFYLKDNQIYTLTASGSGLDNFRTEVDSIFAHLLSSKAGL